jgi:hypothetical protein
MRALADECCNGRLVLVLVLVLVQEGGYALSYAAYCLHTFVGRCTARAAGLADPLAYMQEDCAGLDDFVDRWRKRYAAALDRG